MINADRRECVKNNTVVFKCYNGMSLVGCKVYTVSGFECNFASVIHSHLHAAFKHVGCLLMVVGVHGSDSAALFKAPLHIKNSRTIGEYSAGDSFTLVYRLYVIIEYTRIHS